MKKYWCALAVFSNVYLISATGIADTSKNYEFYKVVFGYQDGVNRPEKSHAFATFVEVTRAQDSDEIIDFKADTISWLPETKVVSIFSLMPETGHNFTLAETLDIAANQQLEVRRWGPVRIDAWLYHRSKERIEALNSGRIGYKAFDSLFRWPATVNAGGAVNCVHAISDIGGQLLSPFDYGFAASNRIFQFLGHRIAEVSPHFSDWVADELHIGNIPNDYSGQH